MQGHTYVFLTSLLVHGTEILLINCSALQMQRMTARINDKKKKREKKKYFQLNAVGSFLLARDN
jgi:hypothetical protein